MPPSDPGRPEPSEYAPYHEAYVGLVPDGGILAVLEGQVTEMRGLLDGIADAAALERHAPYTWSIKEVVGHVADAERVFGYRTIRFARGDATPLPGFDENGYVEAAGFDATPLGDLLAEWEALRRANILALRRLDAGAWSRRGVANQHSIGVRAMASIMGGHVRHHLNIVRRRLSGA